MKITNKYGKDVAIFDTDYDFDKITVEEFGEDIVVKVYEYQDSTLQHIDKLAVAFMSVSQVREFARYILDITGEENES